MRRSALPRATMLACRGLEERIPKTHPMGSIRRRRGLSHTPEVTRCGDWDLVEADGIQELARWLQDDVPVYSISDLDTARVRLRDS